MQFDRIVECTAHCATMGICTTNNHKHENALVLNIL